MSKKSDTYQCLSLTREWLSFFKDKHITAAIDSMGLTDGAIRQFYANDLKTSWTESDFSIYLHSNEIKKDSLEGVWGSDSGIYKIGIVRSDNKEDSSFVAFITEADSIYWMPQHIKFEIKKTGKGYQTKYFRSKDHSYVYPILQKELDTLNFGVYRKWFKNPKEKIEQVTSKAIVDLSPKFKIIDQQTALFSFASLNYVRTVDTLIKQNEIFLRNIKHLIIDLRNNAGGSVLVYEKIIPYLYTNPILKEGDMVLATVDNIKGGYSNMHPELSDSLQSYFKDRIAKLNAHQGELYKLYPIDTLEYSSLKKNIPNVFPFQ